MATEESHGEPREIEWQLDAVDLRPVERWLRSRPAETQPRVEPGSVGEHRDTYFDSADWRLHLAGWTLRSREQDGRTEATLKSMGSGEDGRRDRREFTATVDGDSMDTLRRAHGPVGDRLRALIGSRPLQPMFEIRTRRRTFPLSVNGSVVAELALDDTAIPMGDERPATIQRVEVEVTGDDPRDAAGAFVDELRGACALRPATTSKFEAGLLASGLAPPGPPDLGPTEVTGSASVGELAFAAMRTHFTAFLEHEPGTRLGDDPEEVHDMRVATRRLRAAMSTFRDALPVRVQALRRELKWIADALGNVRDLDVQIEQVGEWARELPEEERGALAPITAVLERRRVARRKEMLRALDSRRCARLVASTTGLLQRGPLRRSAASRAPAAIAGPDLVRWRRGKMKKAGAALNPDSPAEDLHRLRIRGKRLRYTLEFLTPVYPKDAPRLAKRLSKMQDVLGLHQDARVAAGFIAGLLEEHAQRLQVQTVFVLGRVAEQYRHVERKQRSRLPKVYGRLTGKAWKDLRSTMDKTRSEAEAAQPRRRAPRAPAPPADLRALPA
jgi:CHAD domain-containing protein